MYSQRQTDTHADTCGPPLRQNKHLDLELEAYKHTLSHTCAPTFRQTDPHRHTVSSLCDRDSCLGCFGASHYSPPLPGPSEPQLSVPGTKDSVGEEEAKGARRVVYTQWLLGRTSFPGWGEVSEGKGWLGGRGGNCPGPS